MKDEAIIDKKDKGSSSNPSLVQAISAIINEKGFIPVDQFVNLCLYHDKYGYYKTKNPFGYGGDFTTSSQMTSLFGESIGLFFASQYKRLSSGKKCVLIELGPGNGFFMRDALNIAKMIPEFYNNLEVKMVETSESLISEQKQILSEHAKKISIEWSKDLFDTIDDIDDDVALYVFANEFFDALPVRQFVKVDKGVWNEIVVTFDENGMLAFGHTEEVNANHQIESYLSSVEEGDDVVDGSIVEVSQETIKYYDYICRKVAKCHSGLFLTIDYGYIKNSFSSTLRAVSSHKEVDIFEAIGNADITYLVDFSTIYSISRKYKNLTTYQPMNQNSFLKAIGIEARLEKTIQVEQNEAKKELAKLAVERIVSEDKMGSLFKVAIVEKHPS